VKFSQGVGENESVPVCYVVYSGNPKNTAVMFRVKPFNKKGVYCLFYRDNVNTFHRGVVKCLLGKMA
jgi:hypothetical protein